MAVSTTFKSFFSLPDFTKKPVFKFISKRIGPFDGTVVLDKNRVYILPTRFGVIFAVLLLLLLLGSVNYSKSLGFMLTFLLAGLGNIAMFATWRNIAGLRLRAGGSMPVFAGEEAVFAVQLENLDPQMRYSIAVSREGHEYEIIDVPADGLAQLHFQVATRRRGMLNAGRFRLYTEFPSGLFVAWTWIELSMQCLVYPKPAFKADELFSNTIEEGEHDYRGAGQEEYTGLRKYQAGDSWRHVAWKAVARSGELYTKEFAGGQPQLQWIEWNALAMSGTENRLSMMTRMVIDAEEAGRQYGLRLPKVEVAPGRGSQHYSRCLKVLALYGD
jgi:uncharacterized protein (DUF58 family)